MTSGIVRKFRRPVHVGTRAIAENSETTVTLVAVPLLPGEVVERIALDCMGVTRDDETNVDQPPIFSWIAGYVPVPLFAGGPGLGVDASFLDARLRDMWASGAASYLGGDPASGDLTWLGAGETGQWTVNFRRSVIGDPIPVGKDDMGNSDARFIDRFRTVIERPYEVKTTTLWIFGAFSSKLDAQTEFGVQEIDADADYRDLAEAYRGINISPTADTERERAYELLYGGDAYIEADSFKETAKRHYAIARPAIRLSQLPGMPGQR